MSQESRLRAIIWLPDDREPERWKRICLDWCERHRADITAIIHAGPDAEQRWEQVRRMAWNRQFDYLVVASESHLPARRLPRIVVVANEPKERRRRAGRRPRLID